MVVGCQILTITSPRLHVGTRVVSLGMYLSYLVRRGLNPTCGMVVANLRDVTVNPAFGSRVPNPGNLSNRNIFATLKSN